MQFNGLAEFGSYDRSNYRASYGGTFGSLRLNFGVVVVAYFILVFLYNAIA